MTKAPSNVLVLEGTDHLRLAGRTAIVIGDNNENSETEED
jgi:hypothetical protein